MKAATGWTRTGSRVLSALLVTWTALGAVAGEPVPPPRPKVIVEERPEKQAAYRALFEKVGRAGLPDLTKDKDTGTALHASWELHKKLVKRTAAVNDPTGRRLPADTYDTYDPDEVKKFLGFLKDRTKAPVLEWWAKGMSDLSVEKGKFHLHLGVDPKRAELTEVEVGDRVWHVRKGLTLTFHDDMYAYKSGDVLLKFPKPKSSELRFHLFTGDSVADVIGEKIVCLATYSSFCAMSFRVAGFESKGGKCLWESEVWALARAVHAGSSAGHRVELTTKDSTVFVFGEEIGGLYLEAFDLETGKCQFRFCTSYWGDYSEKWNMK